MQSTAGADLAVSGILHKQHSIRAQRKGREDGRVEDVGYGYELALLSRAMYWDFVKSHVLRPTIYEKHRVTNSPECVYHIETHISEELFKRNGPQMPFCELDDDGAEFSKKQEVCHSKNPDYWWLARIKQI